MQYAKNKAADQPENRGSLISAVVICSLDSILSVDALSKMSRFLLL